jgi:hypothetical protein
MQDLEILQKLASLCCLQNGEPLWGWQVDRDYPKVPTYYNTTGIIR